MPHGISCTATEEGGVPRAPEANQLEPLYYSMTAFDTLKTVGSPKGPRQ